MVFGKITEVTRFGKSTKDKILPCYKNMWVEGKLVPDRGAIYKEHEECVCDKCEYPCDLENGVTITSRIDGQRYHITVGSGNAPDFCMSKILCKDVGDCPPNEDPIWEYNPELLPCNCPDEPSEFKSADLIPGIGIVRALANNSTILESLNGPGRCGDCEVDHSL